MRFHSRTLTNRPMFNYKHLRNTLSVTSILLICLFLCACKGNNRQIRIGVSQCSNDAWHVRMDEEIRRETAFYSEDIILDFRHANNSNERQIAQIDSLIRSGIDLLIVSPNEAKPLTPIIDQAFHSGIPIVTVDRRTDSDRYTAFIGTNNVDIGADAAGLISKALPKGGSAIELTGSMESTAARERHAGLERGLEADKSVRLIASKDVGWEGEYIESYIDSLLSIGEKPDIAFAHNDHIAIHARELFAARGLHTQVIGVDGLDTKGGGLEHVENGTLLATFANPTGGGRALQTAMKILRDEPFQREQFLSPALINRETARVFRLQSDQMHEKETRIDFLDGELDNLLREYTTRNMLLSATALILFLLALLLFGTLRFYYTTRRSNRELALQKEKLETQRDALVNLSHELEESTRSKLTFFTEISHDLRTPLTLILAPLEQLATEKGLTQKGHQLLQTMKANAEILLRLVNQTLDFRRFEAGQLHPTFSPLCPGNTLKVWGATFQPLAQKKMIRFRIQPDTDEETAAMLETPCLLDSNKTESIVYNLLSNAFRFTPEGGRISVGFSISADDTPRLVLTVSDSGCGIPADRQNLIFERFYQTDFTHQGSGIGLATVKAYTEIQGGTVKAESTPGKGTTITVSLPYHPASADKDTGKEAPVFESEENENAINFEFELPKEDNNEIHEDSEQPNDDDRRPTVLIIDDVDDIRSFIRMLLSDDYRIEEASNGRSGLATARRLMPDAIICDALMPVMNGWECCKLLKEDSLTCHIPVMMVTACTLEEHRIAAFDSGCDSYISKPFNPEVLRARLRNLLKNRSRLLATHGHETPDDTKNLCRQDKSFIERLRQLINERLTDTDLSVDFLASEMGLSRAQLYRKVKALTGNTPIEILRVARLKRASELLLHTEMTVSEIAYELGFSTPGYLSRCFREYFGETPKEYVEKRK